MFLPSTVFLLFVVFIYLFIFCIFRAAPVAYGGSQARGLIQAVATSLHHSHSNAGSRAASATYTAAHGNTGSLIHWVRPGIKPTSSWVLVGFITTEPQWDFLNFKCISNILHLYSPHNFWVWYHICIQIISYLTVYVPLLVSFPIHNFLFLAVVFSLSPREVLLAFAVNLIWWCWIILAFSCL